MSLAFFTVPNFFQRGSSHVHKEDQEMEGKYKKYIIFYNLIVLHWANEFEVFPNDF